MRRIALPFIAGFLATLLAHQPVLYLLHLGGIVSRAPYSMKPVPPFGVPSVISLAFWGGVWGIVLIAFLAWVRRDAYWIAAAAFGAVAPSFVALFVIAPMKHLPVAGGWKWSIIAVALLINGAWGLGTAAINRLLGRKR